MEAPDTPERMPSRRAYGTLIVCWLIFFTQYANSVMLTAFFPNSAYGRLVGESMVGAIFAAYPLATALAIPVPPWCIARIGIRQCVLVGLILAATGSLLCGFVPDTIGPDASPAVVSVILLGTRALSGLGAALAEAGCFTALSTSDFGRRMGLVMSSCEVLIGVGSAIGTALGGELFELGKDSAIGSWRLPFVVSATGPCVLLPFLVCLPARKPAPEEPAQRVPESAGMSGVTGAWGGEDLPSAGRTQRTSPKGGSSLCAVCTGRRSIVLTSVFFGSAMIEATAPLLQPYAGAPPISMSNAAIGLVVSVFSFCYMAVALPLGLMTDRNVSMPKPELRLRFTVLIGWVGLSASFALLGPFAFLSPSKTLLASMVVGGTFSAWIVVPSMPELQLGIDESDEGTNAALCSLWNGMYSGGSAVGPLAASSLFGFSSATASLASRFVFTISVLLAFSSAFTVLLALAAGLQIMAEAYFSRQLGHASSAATVSARSLLLCLRRRHTSAVASGLARPYTLASGSLARPFIGIADCMDDSTSVQ